MHSKRKKITQPNNKLPKVNRYVQMDSPFLVLSELNFPFIINLNNLYKDHLSHHSIISFAKRRS